MAIQKKLDPKFIGQMQIRSMAIQRLTPVGSEYALKRFIASKSMVNLI